MKQPLIILTGPTAVGKTKLSITLAKAVNGAVISADSMQIYKYMDIGSAKIMPQEMDGIPHYLIDELDPSEEFHVVRFQEMAKQALQEIYQNGQIPILTGGTGFYIQALVKDIDFTEAEEDREYRTYLEEQVNKNGPVWLHDRLADCDPKAAKDIHANNVKRVIRALEYYHQTGEPISIHNEREKERISPYNYAYFVLNDERSRLNERIELRIDQMLKDGLLEEVLKLKEMGYTRDMVSMQGLGYKEILDYYNKECTLDEAIYRLKRDTRHFAKRQITWFKRESDVIWLNKPDFSYDESRILEEILSVCRRKGITGSDTLIP